MYISRLFFVIPVILMLFAWVGFKFPELFIHGRRSAALTKTIGENASKKLARYVGAPLAFLAACFLMGVAIDQEITIRAAEKGDAAAQYELAGNVFSGDFQRKDFEKAIGWYLQAARNGHPDAAAFIDMFTEHPNRVAENDTDIFSGYRILAEAGLSEAQWRLGECYRVGHGTTKDTTAAFRWYTTAAESGHERAFESLGYCCARGIGTEKDIAEAVRWYELSSDRGSAHAQTDLGLLYLTHFRDDAHRMRAARKLFKSAHEKNGTVGLAAYCMGYMTLYGIETTRDPAMAFVWFSLAADRGSQDGLKMRDRIGAKLTAAQLEWARELKEALDARKSKTQTIEGSPSAIVTGPVQTRTAVKVVRPGKKEDRTQASK